jgi:phosphoribosyl 1,2-cyclic phosphodiesterase
MQLKILGSSSAGNCYILENEKSTLIIECGLPLFEVKKAVDFKLNKINGCLVTHEHSDHSKYAKEYAAAGIPVMASEGTLDALKLTSHAAKRMRQNQICDAGDFQIMGFKVKHDAAEPMGFLIKHPEAGKILFATDTSELEYDFNGLTQIMIEANYSEAITYQLVMNGHLNARHQARVEQSHMSLETVGKFLKRTDLTSINNIVLLHLSNGNSNAREFKELIQQQTAKTVTIADKGININFSKTPF